MISDAILEAIKAEKPQLSGIISNLKKASKSLKPFYETSLARGYLRGVCELSILDIFELSKLC